MLLLDTDNVSYIGKNERTKLFNLNNGSVDEIKNNLIQNEKSDKFSTFLSYNERIIRLLNFIDSFNGDIPALFGRVFYIKNNVNILSREFFSFKNSDLDKCIGKLKGQIYIEFIVLDSTFDLKDIIDFCKLGKIKYSIFHLFNIEDNDIYLSSKFIHRLYIPDYILNFVNKKD